MHEGLPPDIPWRAGVEYTPAEIELHATQAQGRAIMAARANRRGTTEAFAIGDYVTVKVDRMDRHATDNQRAFCKVLQVGENAKYRLLSQLGILKTMYPVSMLLRVPSDSQSLAAAALLNAPTTSTTLHAVAAANSTSAGDQVAIKCGCKKNSCTSGRCKCFKNDVGCSIYCHGDDRDCGNLSSIQTRTELALISRTAESGAAGGIGGGAAEDAAGGRPGAADGGAGGDAAEGAAGGRPGAADGGAGRGAGRGVRRVLGRSFRYGHKRTNTAVGGQVVSGRRVRGGKVVGRQGEE